MEVDLNYQSSFFKDAFDPDDKYFSALAEELPGALMKKNSDKVAMLFHDLLSSIASEQHAASEQHYHAVLHSSLLAAGLEVHSQESGARGRSDIAVFLNDKIRIVIELKYCKSNKKIVTAADEERSNKELTVALNKAQKTIRDKDYAGPFRAARCVVICMAFAIRGRDEVAVRFFEP
ncbi:MAG: PD-(D/E)XK nuclease domain-containing protein [Deltaproteobacteria bacterium]|nr:PD-(D/E)XK nuclease domain-containing protein [Deltaproteobacteria bacterium]